MSAVLVIDDDAALNDAIRRVLEATGVERVDGTLLLKKGQQLALENHFDIIFLDTEDLLACFTGEAFSTHRGKK